MILLDYAHRALMETLRDRFAVPALHAGQPGAPLRNSEPVSTLVQIADFDGVSYRLTTPESKTVLVLSMKMPCWRDLEAYGAREVMSREYGDMLLSTPEQGYDVSLRVDVEKLPADPADRDALVKKLALLKRNAMAAPYEKAFEAQKEGSDSPMMVVRYRESEAIYIKGMADRVTVVFSTEFKEEEDRIFGKVFLQEFVDARRQPQTQNSPQVLYSSREPPLELRGQPGLKDSENIGYVTFVLFPRHFTPPASAADCISKIQLFRNYLHYHIKCSKAYMHSRMRTRVAEMLKVLNRAKPEAKERQLKTAS
ncbi:actin-related protein ARPC2 [Hyaloraphidium curvatum]|nr:actin-related protein ARPC2 [Hyaloraphidium curvatum]